MGEGPCWSHVKKVCIIYNGGRAETSRKLSKVGLNFLFKTNTFVNWQKFISLFMFLAKTGQILGNFASVGEKTNFWQGIMFLQTVEVSKKGGKSKVLSTENTIWLWTFKHKLSHRQTMASLSCWFLNVLWRQMEPLTFTFPQGIHFIWHQSELYHQASTSQTQGKPELCNCSNMGGKW